MEPVSQSPVQRERSIAKQAIAITVLVALGALGAWIADRIFGGGDEERPPIIVMNGSVRVFAEYPDDKHEEKGSWIEEKDDQGRGKGWYRHHHKNKKTDKFRVSVFNGACDVNALRAPITITYGQPTGDASSVEFRVVDGFVEFDPKGAKVTVENTDASSLTLDTVGTIRSVESGQGGSCTFAAGSQPVIRIVQNKK